MQSVFEPAGFWIRFGASLIDGIVIFLIVLLFSLIFNFPVDNDSWQSGLLEFLYALSLPLFWYGYTVGKRLCGIRIARVDGEKLHIGNMLLRIVVAGLFYALTIGIGFLVSVVMVAVREDKRAIHDFVAGTCVTYNPPERS
ncbi:RDD family protein [Bacillus timonensis]|uniref:RDD family protein n=1 Tax=Bacillus timonensis TaxID=1033734 RepID=A0A4S3PLL8_9BACI|nr:RDD family protein [Bacillus timonensis]THE10339.1 RDD family protein [Bacillus timonensis]